SDFAGVVDAIQPLGAYTRVTITDKLTQQYVEAELRYEVAAALALSVGMPIFYRVSHVQTFAEDYII
ncbi:MAG: TOBE-like domain-containing protein, partial [Spirochaetes bacterium]|nr:TOBE-like domain-containing protein [Spirochaetota bacterium]